MFFMENPEKKTESCKKGKFGLAVFGKTPHVRIEMRENKHKSKLQFSCLTLCRESGPDKRKICYPRTCLGPGPENERTQPN